MAETADYYKVLGVDSKATPAEIKSAYHTKAKRAHPDAGGSQAEMERLNHAYQVLSSPLARRDYDAERHRPEPRHQPTHASGHHPAQPGHHARNDFHRQRRGQARAVAFQMLARSLIAAVILTVLTHFLLPSTTGAIRWLLLLLGFIPLYLTALAVVFLIDPDLRLQLFDLAHLGGWRPKIGLFRLLCLLILSSIPLAVLWVWLGSA